MNGFDYIRPSSVADATRALVGPNATALAVGHMLIPTLKQCLAKPPVLVDSGGIAELKGSGIRVAVSGPGAKGMFRVAAMEQPALKGNSEADGVREIGIPASGLISDMHGGADCKAGLITVMGERAHSEA